MVLLLLLWQRRPDVDLNEKRLNVSLRWRICFSVNIDFHILLCVCVRARLCARGEKFLTARIILRADRLRALVSFFLAENHPFTGKSARTRRDDGRNFNAPRGNQTDERFLIC